MWHLLLLIVLLFGGCAQKEFHLRILHINDTHSHIDTIPYKIPRLGKVHIGGYAAIATYAKQARRQNPNTLFLHAGDALQGSLYHQLFRGKADSVALNLMGFDAMTLGNHEFDDGFEALRQWMERIHFPLLLANASGVAGAKPYVIYRFGSQRVAVIGVSTTKIKRAAPSIQMSDPIRTVRRVVKKLEKEGVDKIVVLSHLGLWQDRQLAREVPQIDLIVGGHSHTLLGDFSRLGLRSDGPYPLQIGTTLIVHAWKWGMVIGDIELTFDDHGRVVEYVASPRIIVHDPALAKRYPRFLVFANESKGIQKATAIYRKIVKDLRNHVIGEALVDLWHVRLPCQKAPDGSVLPNGSLIAPHVAEAIRETSGAQIAIINAGGVRKSFFTGPISKADVMELLPFDDRIVVLEVRGERLEALLQDRIRRALGGRGGPFPYVAGVRIWIDGERIRTDLRPNRLYQVATTSFLAAGGAGYRFENESIRELGFLQEAMAEYIVRHKRLGSLQPLIYIECEGGNK